MPLPPVIDHNPHEPPRQTKTEVIFVTGVTAIVLTLAGLFLKWVAAKYGAAAMLAVVAVELAVIFPLAFWLDRKK